MKSAIYQKNRTFESDANVHDKPLGCNGRLSLIVSNKVGSSDTLTYPHVNKRKLKPTTLTLALLSLGMSVSTTLLAAPTDTLPVSNTLTANSQTASNDETINATTVTTDPNEADANKPYQYQLPNQPVLDHISQQIANRTLTPDFNNFNQPVATLKQNQPSVGYNAEIAEPSNAPVPAPASNQSLAQKQAQVIEQLNEDNNVPQDTPQNAQQNAANQTENIDVNATINPNDYLPEYQQQTATNTVPQQQSTVTASTPNPLKRIYNKVLNKAQGANYLNISVANADDKQQPAKNIKAALEQVTVESVTDFLPSVGKLRQIALDAAQAVGYYDTEVSFKHLGGDKIEVNIKAGEPVLVKNRLVDIRGEGADGEAALPVYQAIEQEIPPKEGSVFNHGVYKTSKATIEGVSSTNGYFDAKWLNSSADVILPDNTADVDLVYDTQRRYKFGDVKIYSIDKKGNLTDDPDKLPVKPELLEQLMTYQKNDPYYQPFVTQFANNLSATRYFNGVDMDVVMPATNMPGSVTSNTLANSNAVNANSSTTSRDVNGTNDPVNNTESSIAQNVQSTSDANANADNSTANTSETADNGTLSAAKNTVTLATATQNPDDIAPINFDVDASTQERLKAIKTKANNLLHAPQDIQLAPEETNNSKNPLVILANGVSKIAKKIDSHGDDTPRLLAQAQENAPINKLTPQQVYEQKAVPTYVVLNANKTHEAQVGIGYETDVGVRVVGKLNNNLVNRDGLQAGVNVAASKVNQSIEATASYPYKHPLNDKITGSIGYQHNNSEKIANTFESESLYANVARNIYRDTGWNRTYSLRYRTDKLSLGEGKYEADNLPYPFNNQALGFNQESLLLGYGLTKTVADNRLAPTYGYSQRYSVEVGADGLLSDTNMAILKAGATGIYSFGENKKQQVIGRADLGYIYSDNFYDVPYRLRFFAGGDQSIRGYNNESLSPEFGDQKFLMGGDALAVGSLEYNYEVRPGLRAALFSDFGNAYDLSGENDNSTKVGMGAGVRWASPIGTVRLDVASGISDGGDPIRIHFFIGSPL